MKRRHQKRDAVKEVRRLLDAMPRVRRELEALGTKVNLETVKAMDRAGEKEIADAR